MIGIPCSGKTTLAEQMRKNNPNLRIVSSNAVMRDLGLPHDKTSNQTVFAEVNRRLESLLRKDCDVILDATNLDEKYREEPMKIARSCDARIIAKIVSADFQVCEERNAERIANRVPDDAMQAMYHQFKNTIQNLSGFDDIEVIGTSGDKFNRLTRRGRVRNDIIWGSR